MEPPDQHRTLPVAQQGQIFYLFALLLVVMLGVGALALDVGIAYHQRQQMQNMATNAALAGAYELYPHVLGTPLTAQEDAQVYDTMRDVLTGSGLTLVTPSPPPSNACTGPAPYPPNQVYMIAQYTNNLGTPLPTPYVGSGSPVPADAAGVRVDTLGGCSPSFLARVLGRQNFAVSANAMAGSYLASGGAGAPTDTPVSVIGTIPALAMVTSTDTPLPTLTTTPTPIPSAYQVSEADVMIYGSPPGVTLYGKNAPDYPAGDLVTVFANAGNWAADQYANQYEAQHGIPGTPVAVQVHDSSLDGCYSQNQTTYAIGDILSFNHNINRGGVGNCDKNVLKNLSAGSQITIPVVDYIQKNTDACNQNGGYCEQVRAIVTVTVQSVDWPHIITGYITAVISDPDGLVQVAPPTATPTVTETPTPTNTQPPPNP
jgi:hypothetical protein